MNTEPLVTATPSRWISGLNHNGHRGRYRRVAPMETIPSYESLAAVMRVLEDIQKPQLWAREKLKAMTGCGANWKAMESEPPNETAERAAVSVLRKAYTLRPLEPSYVTVSAEGGIGIVYKTDKKYAAIECLNNGQLWLLWIDSNGEPQSRRVKRYGSEVKKALEQVAALHSHA